MEGHTRAHHREKILFWHAKPTLEREGGIEKGIQAGGGGGELSGTGIKGEGEGGERKGDSSGGEGGLCVVYRFLLSPSARSCTVELRHCISLWSTAAEFLL